MTKLLLPAGIEIPTNLDRPMRDMRLTHRLVQKRWANLKLVFHGAGFDMFENETWRPDERQRWLYAQGRTRPGAIVTNSNSASNSAHGWTEPDGHGNVIPAACGIDVVPLGKDGKPWTKDDPWTDWLAFALRPEVRALGLIHFAKPGKQPWDTPHLQLVEWSDKVKKLILPPGFVV